MICVDNIQFYTTYENIINDFTAYLSDKYNISIFGKQFKSGTDLMCCCPFHGGGQERKPSFGIELDKGIYQCFTCGAKGTFEQLINKIFVEYNIKDRCIDYLIRTYNQSTGSVNKFSIIKKQIERPKAVEEKLVAPTHSQMYNYINYRGISKDVADKYNVYEDNDYVYFNVFDINGNYKYTTNRSKTGKFFHIPGKSEKEVWLANFFKNERVVAICESQFNALSMIEHNIPAVALFGTGDKYQYDILKKFNSETFILALDDDVAGRTGRAKLYNELKDKYIIHSVFYGLLGFDINDYHKNGMFDKLNIVWGVKWKN